MASVSSADLGHGAMRHGLIVLAVAVAVYAAGWLAHALILQRPGPADGFYASTGGVVHDILAAHSAMLRENARLTASHPDASAPWTWPLMKVAPYFWQGTRSSIYLVGNPVIWWGSSLAAHRGAGGRATRTCRRTAALDCARRIRAVIPAADANPARPVSVSLPDALAVRSRLRPALARPPGLDTPWRPCRTASKLLRA